MNDEIKSVEESINQYIANLKSIPKEKITAVIYIIITLVLVGFFQFISADFAPSIFLSANFWISEATTLVIIFTSYQGGINIVWTEQLKNTELLNAMAEYDKLNKRDTDFEEFLACYNRDLKKAAFVRKQERIQKRIEALLPIVTAGIREKLTRKIKEINASISADELEARIDERQVRYYRIYVSDFFTASAKSTAVKLRSRGNAEAGKLKASIKGFPLTIAIATLTSSMVYTIADGAVTKTVIVNLVINAIIFGLRLANGILKASKVIYQEIQMPLEFKNQILRKYKEWQKKEGRISEQC